ncbi:hypothetical protein EYF80_003341 [Liparis tanakae]|uniref:Uncharacterized protein n=1 Tax=Liparis tanakae TaxID=230148 RepID=A0A4Z2J9H6_9TELE|nr:hypothetical protein EYF80_003341 [Liparis tanakae]
MLCAVKVFQDSPVGLSKFNRRPLLKRVKGLWSRGGVRFSLRLCNPPDVQILAIICRRLRCECHPAQLTRKTRLLTVRARNQEADRSECLVFGGRRAALTLEVAGVGEIIPQPRQLSACLQQFCVKLQGREEVLVP